jgi:thiamine-monophosphate kinase
MRSLKDVGEKTAVAEILNKIGSTGSIGLGDDAAAIELGSRFLIVSTDMISRRTHMPDCMSHYQMGWMAAAVNYSDIAAMGASPLGLVMAMGLPRDLPLDSLSDMVQGVKDCSESVSAEYLGGDTKECPEITLTGTSLGIVRKDGILRRSGAKPGELLAVTGSVGLAGAAFLDMDGEGYDGRAREAALEPKPRIKLGTLLSSSGAVGACMDTSDGLAMSLYELAKSSGVGFSLDYENLPIDKGAIDICQRCGHEVSGITLFSGGDYQLLFTIKMGGLERVRNMLGDEFSVIGRATVDKSVVLVKGGERSELPNKGYVHFIG